VKVQVKGKTLQLNTSVLEGLPLNTSTPDKRFFEGRYA
jgi:hypothetical protein